MGQLEEKIGADFLRLLAAKQRLTVLDGKAKKMIADLNMAIQLLSGSARPQLPRRASGKRSRRSKTTL